MRSRFMAPAASAKPRQTSLLRALLAFDRTYAAAPPLLALLDDGNSNQQPTIIGVDEVGRGCLAGPVVAAAVILPPVSARSKLERQLSGLNDSKSVTPRERARLSAILREIAVFVVAEASVEEIDRWNIFHASYLAMQRALTEMKAVPSSIVLVDGNHAIPRIIHHQVPVVKGDGQSACVAAASIIAKVHRDTFMEKLAEEYPEYGWKSNKGYGSRDHRAAIDRVGPSPWHRRTFLKNTDPEIVEE